MSKSIDKPKHKIEFDRHKTTTGEYVEDLKGFSMFAQSSKMIPKGSAEAIMENIFPTKKVWNPIQWALDHDIELWSKPIEMLEALMAKPKVAVYSCHNVGKSFTAAQIVILSWVDTYGHDALVLFTGPDHDRVHNVTGQELRDGVEKLVNRTTGRRLSEHIEVLENDHIKYKGALRGFGRKPPDHKDNGFSGIHGLYPLVVVEEGCHVPKWMFDSASTITSNRNGKTLVLGNPDNPNTHFRRIKNQSRWKTVKIAAEDSPNFTGEPVSERLASFLITPEWVEEKKEEWGENSPLYVSKVMAEFPEASDDQVIGFDVIDVSFTEVSKESPALCLALDVASSGKDEAVAYTVRRNGDIVKEFSYSKSDLMALADESFEWWQAHPGAFVVVDANGNGEGVWSRLVQMGCRVRPFIGQKPARKKDIFENRRAEAAFDLERALRTDKIRLPQEDDILRGELPTLTKERGQRGKWKLMSKEDMERRGLASPNRADAVCMAVWELGLGKVKNASAGPVSRSVPMALDGYAS